MIDVEYEDEADINGETEPVEVDATGDVDHDGNVTNLRIETIYAHGIKKGFTLKDLNFQDVKRITEKAEKEILTKYEEEGYSNDVDFDDNFYCNDNENDEAEVEKIVSKREWVKSY